jgi:hypothetical protein
MTKAKRIRDLYATGKTTRQVACIVWDTKAPTKANLAYCRTAGRQRLPGKPGHTSVADRRYLRKRYGTRSLVEAWRLRQRERYADPVRYAAFLKTQRLWRKRRSLEAQAESR